MKKTLAIALILSLTAFTACNNTMRPTAPEDDFEFSGAVSSASEISAAESSEGDLSDETESSFEPPVRANVSDNFKVGDYIVDFDDVEFTCCNIVGDLSIPQSDGPAVAKAVEAYRSSDYYAEALEEAKEYFHYENGRLVRSGDYTQSLPATWLEYYIDETAAPEIALKAEVLKSYNWYFEGGGEKTDLIMLRAALPSGCMDWSGNAYHMYIIVYVNASGEAAILDDVCRQDYGGFDIIDAGGRFRALFNFGHNESGQRSAVYSFKNGAAERDLHTDGAMTVKRGMLLSGYGWYSFEPILWDAEHAKFCGLKSSAPSEELAEIICSDKHILADYPDAWEIYRNGGITVVGGKYVSFVSDNPHAGTTYVFDHGNFEKTDTIVSTGKFLPEEIDVSYNVKM